MLHLDKENIFCYIFGPPSESEEVEEVDDDILEMVPVYQNSDSISQISILSLINHERYSKQKITSLFGSSKYKVDLKRIWKQQNACLFKVQKDTFTRNQFNFNKCEHFLDFIFSCGLLQDIAYGVQKLKFTSGETETALKAIITSQHSHIICLYKEACKILNYDILSESFTPEILKY